MKEIWKDIIGYEGLYKVSNTGKIISLKNNKKRIIKLFDNHYGYLCVILTKNNNIKSKKVHRLVAEAFISNPNNYPCVNHKDENRYNNNINNLEWCSYSYNNCYGNRIQKVNKKMAKSVNQYNLNGKFLKEWESASQIQRELGYFANGICNCCNGKNKTSHGYIWKYKNVKED